MSLCSEKRHSLEHSHNRTARHAAHAVLYELHSFIEKFLFVVVGCVSKTLSQVVHHHFFQYNFLFCYLHRALIRKFFIFLNKFLRLLFRKTSYCLNEKNSLPNHVWCAVCGYYYYCNKK